MRIVRESEADARRNSRTRSQRLFGALLRLSRSLYTVLAPWKWDIAKIAQAESGANQGNVLPQQAAVESVEGERDVR